MLPNGLKRIHIISGVYVPFTHRVGEIRVLVAQYWFLDLIALFAFVSTLGVANKLIEFAFLALHLAHIDTADAYWDLLANTLGGFVGYFFFFKFSLEKEKSEA